MLDAKHSDLRVPSALVCLDRFSRQPFYGHVELSAVRTGLGTMCSNTPNHILGQEQKSHVHRLIYLINFLLQFERHGYTHNYYEVHQPDSRLGIVDT